MAQAPVVLLGPQRHAPIVREALAPLVDAHRPVAAITAGWEEREAEQFELGHHLGRRVANLDLNRRAEELFQHDGELLDARRRLQDRLRELRKWYRLRLRYLGRAAEELLRQEGSPDMLEPEREAAFENLRALDAHHLARVQEMQVAFHERWSPAERDHAARHRRELATLISGSAALCVAGGNVGVLSERLWLFDVLGLVPEEMPIVAWSAGAMALADRIVLFHDSPPQGPGYAELWGPGQGRAPGVVPLPHATRRLRLEDPVRIQLLSRRFPDAICAALDEHTQLTWNGRTWQAAMPTRRLAPSGKLLAVEGAR
jgi:hypothetical protein